jgi:hypothetical protein
MSSYTGITDLNVQTLKKIYPFRDTVPLNKRLEPDLSAKTIRLSIVPYGRRNRKEKI